MVELDSTIEAVTIYQEGALVRRSARLLPEAGFLPATLVLGGLPLALEDGSVRVSLRPEGAGEGTGAQGEGAADPSNGADKGDAPTKRAPSWMPSVSDLKLGLGIRPSNPGADAKTDAKADGLELEALDRDLRAARFEERQKQGAVELLNRELQRLLELTMLPRPKPERGQPPSKSPVEGRLALLEFRASEVNKRRAALKPAEEALRLATERRQALELQRAQRSGARKARAEELRKRVVFSLRSSEPSEAEAAASTKIAVPEPLTLSLEYLVPGARWSPAYSLHLDATMQQSRLSLRAALVQATGEDWRGVTLTLSTAQAQRWTELPELQALRIGRAQASVKKTGWRDPPEGVEALYADHDAGFAGSAGVAEPATGGFEPEEEWEDEGLDDDWEDPLTDGELEEEVEASPVMRSRSRPQAKRKKMKMGASSFGGAGGPPSGGLGAGRGGGLRQENFEEPALTVDPKYLAYGALFMPPATDPRRGQLVVQAPPQGGRPPGSGAILQGARDRAAAAQQQSWPRGHTPPSTQGGFDYAYQAALPMDLPSDGKVHSLPLLEADAETALEHLCVARESTEVFRQLKLHNPLLAPLLAGPVDVYVDGRYLLGTPLETTPLEGALVLGLGVEQGLKLARNVHISEEAHGLVRGKLGIEHLLELTLTSHLKHEVQVEVRERLPVAAEKDDDVEVSELEVAPAWEPFKQTERALKGGRRWRLSLKPAEERLLKARYRITIPKGHELVGGNRRESSS